MPSSTRPRDRAAWGPAQSRPKVSAGLTTAPLAALPPSEVSGSRRAAADSRVSLEPRIRVDGQAELLTLPAQGPCPWTLGSSALTLSALPDQSHRAAKDVPFPDSFYS